MTYTKFLFLTLFLFNFFFSNAQSFNIDELKGFRGFELKEQYDSTRNYMDSISKITEQNMFAKKIKNLLLTFDSKDSKLNQLWLITISFEGDNFSEIIPQLQDMYGEPRKNLTGSFEETGVILSEWLGKKVKLRLFYQKSDNTTYLEIIDMEIRNNWLINQF